MRHSARSPVACVKITSLKDEQNQESQLTQIRSSGHLNAKHRELLELQKKAQARLAKSRARFAEGMDDAREVRQSLEWTQKKVS